MTTDSARHPLRHPVPRLLAIGLFSLILAACGGDDGTSQPIPDSPPDPPAGGAQVLDCIKESFPCSFDQVALPVIERSLALSDDAANQLAQGATMEQVAGFLAAQSDVADVTVDGPVLGFRLAGGRPMIVDVSGEQEQLANAAEAGAAASRETRDSLLSGARAEAQRSTLRSALTPAALTPSVVAGNNRQRRALVLSPFRYEADFGNAGELVADALNGIRGYTGNVTYLATTNELDPQVTVQVLTQLQQFDVIHIDTHGGTLCKDKPAPGPKTLAKGKDYKNCENGITDFLVQRFHGTAKDLQSIAHPGVVHYRGSKHQSIAITADFFRHYYPEGLADKLFILGSCNTFNFGSEDMAHAIAGSRGIYISWDGYTEFSLVKNYGLALLDLLGQGLTVGEAFSRLPSFSPENPGADGSVLRMTPRRAGGDLRIRDLITVRDNLTGKLVTDTSGIKVKEVPEDGVNDHLDLEFTIDGITPEQLDNFHLDLVIEGKVIDRLHLKHSGIRVDEYSYRVSTPVPLPFDVRKGQSLDMDFWIALPDLGEDHFTAAPKVDGRAESPVGSGWVLTSRAVTSGTDDVTVKTASVEFEIEPGGDPDRRYHYFRVKSGTLNIQRDFEDARGCRFSVNQTITIPAGAANNYLKFDVGSRSIVLDGFGSVKPEPVRASGSCGEAVHIGVGGVYFMAVEELVSGNSISGAYNDGAASSTVIDWSLSKTR